MSEPEPERHKLLDEAMNRRRLDLRINWRQLAEAAGVSYAALRAIRRGDYRPAELTARGLDAALGWAPGSLLSVLDGGEPRLAAIDESAPPSRPHSGGSQVDAIAALLATYPPEVQREIIRRVQEAGGLASESTERNTG